MELHFISTGPFRFMHMIAIKTAIVTQHVDRCNLWYTVKPSGIYFDQIAPLVVLKDAALTEMPVFKGKTPTFQFTHMKDFIMWKILDEKGGIVLDLDTICIKDISSLLDFQSDEFGVGATHLMTASLDVEDYKSIPFPFNSAVVMAVPGTHLTRSIRRFTDASIFMESIPWGLTGPIILSTIARENMARGFLVTPHLVFNPFGGNEINAIYREDPADLVELPKETRVVHLYSKVAPVFDTIDAEWVRTSFSLLARLIKQILPESAWNIRAPWNEDAYLKARGGHYKGLFEVIKEIIPANIMEIGTSSGQTAIGMIRTAGQFSKEDQISYFGVDLFEFGKPSQWEYEFTGGYIPPKKADVETRLRAETAADITLVAFDSKNLHLVPVEERLKMDLIFIDGGHSLETVLSDWEFAKTSMHEKTVVVLDDYFTELPFIGCKSVVDNIDRSVFDVKIMPEIDDYTHPFGRLRTQLVVVRFRQPETVRPIAKPWAKDVLGKVLPGNTRLDIMAAPGRVSRGSND